MIFQAISLLQDQAHSSLLPKPHSPPLLSGDDGICLLESLCALTETKRTLLVDILVNETFCSIQAQNQH